MTTTVASAADSTPSLPSRKALLAHAQASPTAVAAKDKRTWLALFADGGAVHDPVGTPGCAKGAFTLGRRNGPDDLARFYDCFIAPNTIRFEVDRDIVAGRSVVRDVTLHTTGLSGLPTAVPAHLVYTIEGGRGEGGRGEGGPGEGGRGEGGPGGGPGALRIARVEAYWQSADVMRTVRSAGARGTVATVISIYQLVRSLGIKGTRAYLRGVQDRPRTKAAREVVVAWIDAVSAGDEARTLAQSEPSCDVVLPNGDRTSIAAALSGELHGWSLTTDKILISGWAASCTIHMRQGDRQRHGVAVLELARPSSKVRSARLYWDSESATPVV